MYLFLSKDVYNSADVWCWNFLLQFWFCSRWTLLSKNSFIAENILWTKVWSYPHPWQCPTKVESTCTRVTKLENFGKLLRSLHPQLRLLARKYENVNKKLTLDPCLSSFIKYAYMNLCCLNTHTHTHTHKRAFRVYIYIYIYIYCMCVRGKKLIYIFMYAWQIWNDLTCDTLNSVFVSLSLSISVSLFGV